MHIFFCGIGGSGLSGLAHLALDLGFVVSGSDLQNSQNIEELTMRGATIFLGQKDFKNIQNLNQKQKIDWFVQTAAIKPTHPELQFAQDIQNFGNKKNNSPQNSGKNTENSQENSVQEIFETDLAENSIKNQQRIQQKFDNSVIKISKRDEFINFVIREKNLKLIAVAGTHGKTTTTGMLVWLFQKLKIPISYLVGSSITFGKSGAFQEKSEYFVLECDEFDRNFLKFHPEIAIIPSLDYDHPDTYPSLEEYNEAFAQFCKKNSKFVIAWQEDLSKVFESHKVTNLDENYTEKDDSNNIYFDLHGTFLHNKIIENTTISLLGNHNKQNAQLVITCFFNIFRDLVIRGKCSIFKTQDEDWDNLNWFDQKLELKIIETLNNFPGTARRFEKLVENVYSDYAHHPSEIAATLNLAKELVKNME